MAAHLPAAAFVLHTYDSHTNGLVLGFCSEFGLVSPDARVAVGEGLTGWVAATGRSVVNSDARLDLTDGVTERFGLTTTLAVPAQGKEEVLAVLTFYSREADAFTDVHGRIAEAAAEIVAAALARAVPLTAATAA